MIVNMGPTNIGAAELFGATFSATTTDPLVTAFPFVNNPGPPVAPILPHEAVGTILPASPLLDRVLPGETAASRGTSIPQPTAARATTWGALKKLYR